ncbi:Pex19 protein, partial [Piptocephalis cylindrospora]
FQEKMEETMGRLRESSDKASEASSTPINDEDALLQEMMRHMEELAGKEGTGPGRDTVCGMDKMMEEMMSQFMTREVLYEPMRELANKYPDWLRDKKGTLSKEEYDQYKKQLGHIQAMVTHFESSSSSEPDGSDQQDPVISELMEKMQECGQPPAELLQDLAPGMDMDEEGMPQPGNCTL